MTDAPKPADGMPRWALRIVAGFCSILSAALVSVLVWILLGATNRIDRHDEQIQSLESERAASRVEIRNLSTAMEEMRADVKELLRRLPK